MINIHFVYIIIFIFADSLLKKGHYLHNWILIIKGKSNTTIFILVLKENSNIIKLDF